MKKTITILLFLFFISSSYWYNSNNYTLYNLYQQLNSYPSINNYFNKVWNKNTELIWEKYINKEQCNFLKDVKINLNNFNKKYLIELFYTNVNYYIWCNIYENSNKQKINNINTKSARYRIYNITEWLRRLPKIIRPYYTYSVYNSLFENDNKNYVDWYALIYNKDEKKIEDKKVYWWGLCWVATITYQSLFNIQSINILKRYSHSQFYPLYYNKNWQDATIFWSWWYVYKDLKFISYHNSNIFLKPFYNTKEKWKYWYFTYWIKLYSFEPFHKWYVITKKIWKKCFENYIYYTKYTKTIKSCYQDIYK